MKLLLAVSLICLSLSARAAVYSPVGLWESQIMGKDRGTAVVLFLADGTFQSAGIALSGTFSLTGTWQMDERGTVTGYYSRRLIAPFPRIETGYIVAKVGGNGGRLNGKVLGQGVAIRGFLAGSGAPVSGWWQVDVRRAGLKGSESVQLTPAGFQANTFFVTGDDTGLAMVLDNGKAAVALGDAQTGITDTIVVGSINLRSQTGNFRGYGSNGDTITGRIYR